MSREGVWLAAIVAALGLGTIWFLLNFEQAPSREWIGMSGEARRNPYLALQRLSERMGVPAREARTLADLANLPARGALLLPRPRGELARRERDRLLEWTARGGHLIVEAEFQRVPDPMLETLGVRRIAVRKGAAGAPREITLPGVARPVRTELPNAPLLESRHARHATGPKDGAQLLQISYERGLVTVMNDFGVLRNGAIGRHDHAELGWQLVRAGGETAALLVFNNPEKLSLTDWLGEHAWPVLVAAALLLALWLWRIAPRFGPVAPDPERGRRSLLDHLRASGRFLWAAGQGPRLAESAREAALRRLQRAQPDFAALSTRERQERLANTFGLAPEDARQVLAPQAPRSIPEFIRSVRVLQAIHERLARNR